MQNRPRVWGALTAFACVLGVTQVCWLNFAPLLQLIEQRYQVSELAASSLVLVFPLFYALFSVHAGGLVDRLGYRVVVQRGAYAVALFSAARIWTDSFWFLLATQVCLAAAQPYVINAIPKFVSETFDEHKSAMATGICTVGLYGGMAIALATTAPLVAATTLPVAMACFAVVATAAAAGFHVATRAVDESVPRAPAPAPALAPAPAQSVSATELLRNPGLVLLFWLSFCGLGVFNGLTTWLEPLAAANGFHAEQAGLAGGLMILGGIVGSSVIPALSDKWQRRKPVLLACAMFSALLLYALCVSTALPRLFATATALGFFFLPTYAIMLDMCGELAGADAAGQATGLFMLAGNVGSVIVTLAMPIANGDDTSFKPAVWLLVAMMVAVVGLAARAPETARAG